jgi:signal transduction histidine kinase
VGGAKTALLVPMVYRGAATGILAAFDRGEEAAMFTADDEQMLRTFAISAATAVAMARSVQSDRLRSSLAAADAERRRWARELHDETLQGLGGLRVLLSSALRREELEIAQRAMREAVERIEQEIGNLRSIITDLRPASLDELGLRTALEALLDRHRERTPLEIVHDIDLAVAAAPAERLGEELEMAVYRLVQEALTNVVKHAEASRVRVSVGEGQGEIVVEVQDDGIGFDSSSAGDGFGLAGMRERVGLVGGTLVVEATEQGGTRVCARMPASRRAPVPRSVAQQSAS